MVTLALIPFMPVLEDTLTGAMFTMGSFFFSEEPRNSGSYGGPYVDNSLFIWKDPLSFGDGKNGQICTASRAWFPAHRVKWVDGKPYGDIFAPEPQRRPPNLTAPFEDYQPD